MNEQQFNELLKKLKIPTNNRSYADIFDLLDAKLSEYLDRQDDASQELVGEIQDALDYAEIKKNEVGSGIALKREEVSQAEEKADLSDLRDASEKARKEKEQVQNANAQTASAPQQAMSQQQSQVAAGQQAGKLWFSSIHGADNINTMFFQALDDLKYGEFDHARSIFEAILQVEPNNSSAYLGKLMAIFQLKELRAIGNSYDKDIFSDINMRRAYDHGNDQQKKYLDDAKREVECGRKYKDADRKAKDVNNESAQMEAAQMFMALGTYRDAAQRKEQCVERIKELKYERALDANKNASSAVGYRNAADLYREVAGYKNADTLAQECDQMAQRKEAEEAEVKRKDDLKAAFLKLKNSFDAEEKFQRERCENAIKSMATLSPEPGTAGLKERLDAMKKFATDNPEANTLASAQTHISTAEGVMEEIATLAKEYGKLQAMKKSEGGKDRFWIAVVFAALLFAGFPAIFGYDVYSWATFLPIHATMDSIYVDNAKSSYLISLSNIDTLNLDSSDNVKTVVFPNANLSDVTLRNGDYSDLELPDTVKRMSLYSVEGAIIPESVENLSLSREIADVEIQGSVKSLSVYDCTTDELVLPEGLESVSITAMQSLTPLTVPSTVKNFEITESSVKSITLKEGVETAAITGCHDLEELNVSGTVETLVVKYAYNLKELTLPEGVVSCTIQGCESLNTINMPSTLREIWLNGTMSFEGIVFPENVQMIYIYDNETLKDVIYSGNASVVIRGCANLEDVEGGYKDE